MSIHFDQTPDGIVTLRLEGKLQQPELLKAQQALAAQPADGEKAAVLVDARLFEGWGGGNDWGDVDAQQALDLRIAKMAIVAAPAWHMLAAAFTGKGLRDFPIEMFAPADLESARQWLAGA